ncbi:MAG: D-inositol 3-phosphate glycosyltransferase [Candidatus Heimdallarchaeota archaeon LC_2]|nr:MAG: D-inositol 3-phosphate glycosyltransferase [Candidatus Heimdallarchaeota archaeon LC_2]
MIRNIELVIKKTDLILIAHNVNVPLKDHRRIEFLKRVKILTTEFNGLLILSFDHANTNSTPSSKIKLINDKDLPVSILKINTSLIQNQVIIKDIIRIVEPKLLIIDTPSHLLKFTSFLVSTKNYNSPKTLLFHQGFVTELFGIRIRSKFKREVKIGWEQKLLKFYDKFYFNKIDYHICISQPLVDYLKSILPLNRHDDIFLSEYNANYIAELLNVNLTSDQTGIIKNLIKSFEQYLVYSGSLDPNKRPDIAIETIRHLKKMKINRKLVILGDGPLKSSLKRLAIKLDLKDDIVFLNQVTQRMAIEIYQGSDGMIFPTLSEGFGLSALEAMYFNIPLIVYSNRTFVSLTKGKGMLLIPSLDPKDFAQGCAKILKNTLFRANMLKEAQHIVSKFTVETDEERMKNIIRIVKRILLQSRN